jgi:hypothetical protein
MSKTEKTIEGMTVKLKAISHIWLVVRVLYFRVP